MDDTYPEPVKRLHAALERVPGVFDVASGSASLDGLNQDALASADWAHLPHGALHRTRGPLPKEGLIQIELSVEPSRRGWHALEFLGWFIRDLARGGEPVQMRPFGLPPMANGQLQLGRTLGFHIDVFLPEAPSLSSAMEKVDAYAQRLERALALYGPALAAGGPA